MSRLPTGHYQRTEWRLRPLAMRAMEAMLGEPMENLLAAAWFKTRTIDRMCETMGLENTTLRRWMRLLSLYICARCSKRTGRLHYHTQTCTGCGRWFCDDCYNSEERRHLTELLDKAFPRRTGTKRPEDSRCPR